MIAPCSSEFDISIIDRLSPVFNGSPFYAGNIVVDETTTQQNTHKNGFGFTLESSQIDIRLRYANIKQSKSSTFNQLIRAQFQVPMYRSPTHSYARPSAMVETKCFT